MTLLNNIITNLPNYIISASLSFIISTYVATRTKPNFSIMGVNGIAKNDNTIECYIRYSVKFHYFGEKTLARNAQGWISIDDNKRKRLHNANSWWAKDGKPVVDIVGEESLYLFTLIKEPDNKYSISIDPPSSPNSNRLSIISHKDLNEIDGFKITIAVAAENANGLIKEFNLKTIVEKCKQSKEKDNKIIPV